MNELELIIQRMIDAGEPENNIASVIKEYESLKINEPGKITPPKEENQGVPVEENATPEIPDTDLPSEDISSDLQKIKSSFEQGEFTMAQRPAFEEFQKTGEIKQELLPIEKTYERPINPDTGKPFTNKEFFSNMVYNFVGEDGFSPFDPTNLPGPRLLSVIKGTEVAGRTILENTKYEAPAFGTYAGMPKGVFEINEKVENKKLQEAVKDYENIKSRFKQTASISEGLREEDLGQIALGILNGTAEVGASVVPAILTRGASLVPEISGPMISDYNIAKAKELYPEQPVEKAYQNLIDNKELEVTIPAALSTLSIGLERFGIKKFKDFVANRVSDNINKKIIKGLYAANGEGFTEVGQLAVDSYNEDTAKGKPELEKLNNALTIIAEEGVETYLQAFAGTLVFGAGTKQIKKASKSLKNIRATFDKGRSEEIVNEIYDLNQSLLEVKNSDVYDGIKIKIKSLENELNGITTKAASIFSFLENNEINEINNLDDLNKIQVQRVQKLNQAKNNNEISQEDYLNALEGYKKSYIENKNKISGVIKKSSEKENKQAQEVNKIYEEKGKEGVAEILDLYKPMAKRIASKYRNVPGFDMELMTDEILTGERGILDLINSYKPETNVPLSAYVNKYAATRGIEAAQRNLKQEFELDVTEAKGVTDTVTAETEIETQEQVKQEVKTELAKDLNLTEETQNEVITAVEKTLGTKLPAVTDKKFKQALTTGFRNELTNTFKTVFGKTATYEQFLRDNFEKIYPAIPQETINRNFKEFNEPVLDPKTGKQLRERTAEGKKVFKKRDIAKAEFINYFLNAPGNVKGARKTSLAKVLADEIGLDNVLISLSKPEVVEKFKAIQELQEQEVPSNFIEIISEKIDRAINYIEEWQKSNVLRSDPGIAVAAEFVKKVLQSIKLSIKAGIAITEAIKKAVDEASKIFKTQPTTEEKTEYVKEISLDIKKYEDIDKLNIDDLMDRLSRIYYKNKGIQEEQNVILSLLEASKKSKLIKVISKKPAGSNSKGFDVEFEAGNQKINVEIKAANAQYSSMTANFDLDSQEFSFSQNTLFNNLIKKELESVKNSISKYAKEAGSKTWPAKISKEKYKELGSSGKNIQKNITKTFEIPSELIVDLYNKKNINYINIEGKGLYYLKQDIYNLGVPKFNPKASATIRIVPPKTSKAGIKTTTTRIFPKIDYKSLKKSSFDLSDPNSVVELFKNISPSKSLNKEFNKILEESTGVKWTERFSPAKARVMAKGKGKGAIFVPYSADDFVGLLYTTLAGKEKGNQQMDWYRENLLRPFSRGIQAYEAEKQRAMREWSVLKQRAKKDVPGGLKKENESGFTNEQSLRMYMWQKQGFDIPSINKGEVNNAVRVIKKNDKFKSFADTLMGLNPEGYPSPEANWIDGDITSDLIGYVNGAKRSEFLSEWKENKDIIFSEKNITKLRGLYGEKYVEALENILYRMEKGVNRKMGQSKQERAWMDWVNNSVGSIMFFNARSAVLQTLSTVNFINFSDNNPINAAAALANFGQYRKDFVKLFNSDFLKQRRSGLQTDISADEIAKATKGNETSPRALFNALLKIGFTPTQIADSFAIASGGATFYRNRIKKYKKEGLEQKEAEQEAFTDFQEIAEETQQSSRPDRVSMEQAGGLGRVVLAFANTPMQYARLQKKAALDLVNGRGDWKTNISKIAYYGVIQNIIFSALQSALFALLFDDEEEVDAKGKYYRIANSSADSLLRGTGVYGAAAATVKNVILEIINQSKKDRPDYTKAAIAATSISPPINSKLRKLISAGNTFKYKQSREKVFTEGFSLDNPALLAAGKVISAGTNVPADRVVQKLDNVYTAMQPETELWQSIALSLGWTEWDLGMIESQTKKSKTPLRKGRKTIKKKYIKRKSIK